jgi:hypothetical protein
MKPPSHRFSHLASFTVGGIGLGLLAGALATGVSAQLSWNDLNSKCPNTRCANDPSLRDKQNTGQALAISTDVLIGVGSAAVVTGIILFIVEKRRAARLHEHARTVSGWTNFAFTF